MTEEAPDASFLTAVVIPVSIPTSVKFTGFAPLIGQGLKKSVGAKKYKIRHSYVTWFDTPVPSVPQNVQIIAMDETIKRRELWIEWLGRADIVILVAEGTDADREVFSERIAPALNLRRPNVITVVPEGRMGEELTGLVTAQSGGVRATYAKARAAGKSADDYIKVSVTDAMLTAIKDIVDPSRPSGTADSRAAMPLRLSTVSRLSKLRVSHYQVLQGTLRIGDQIMVASDPLRTAVDGCEVISMRTYPGNTPVTVAYPGMHVGVHTAIDKIANDAAAAGEAPSTKDKPTKNESPFDEHSREVIAGRCGDDFPKLPMVLVVEECDRIGNKDVQVHGHGGFSLGIVAKEGKSRLILIEDIHNNVSPSVLSTATPGEVRDSPGVMLLKPIPAPPNEVYMSGSVNLKASHMRLSLHAKVAAAMDDDDKLASVIAGISKYYTISGTTPGFHWLKDPSDTKDIPSRQFRASLANELLCDIGPAQRLLRLTTSTVQIGRFSLLYMLSRLPDQRAFNDALEFIPFGVKFDEKMDAGKLWLPGSSSFLVKETRTLIVQCVAATSTNKQVGFIQRWISQKGGDSAAHLLSEAYITIGAAIPVLRVIETGRAINNELIFKLAQSEAMPPFVMLSIALHHNAPTIAAEKLVKYKSRIVTALQRYQMCASDGLRFDRKVVTIGFAAHAYILQSLCDAKQWRLSMGVMRNILMFIPGWKG